VLIYAYHNFNSRILKVLFLKQVEVNFMKYKINFTMTRVFLLFLLCVFSAQIHSAEISIGKVNSDMIGKSITVSGTIVNVLMPRSDKSPYNVYLTDGADTIRVVIWQTTYNRIANRADLFKHGTPVTVSGTIKEYRGKMDLYLGDPGDIRLTGDDTLKTSKAPVKTALPSGVLSPGQVNLSMKGQTVTVMGTVREYSKAWNENAPSTIYLQGNDGYIRVVFWTQVSDLMKEEPASGTELIIRGKVGDFKGKLQLKLSNISDIMPASGGTSKFSAASSTVKPEIKVPLPPGVLSPGHLNASMKNQTVTVKGTVKEYKAAWNDRAPNSITLQDQSGSVRVVYWSKVADALGRIPKQGQLLSIKGQVSEFKGNIQLNVNNASDIKDSSSVSKSKACSIAAAPQLNANSAVLPSGVLSPGQIDASMKNQTVTVKGTVKEYKAAWNDRAPNSITLQDQSGSVRVVYWSKVADALGQARLPKEGQLLTIKGQVSEFKGNFQLKVKNASDIMSSGMQSSAPELSMIKASSIGASLVPSGSSGYENNPISLSPGEIKKEHIGKYVKVRGKIVDVNPSWKESAPTTVKITDGIKNVSYVYWKDVNDKLITEQQPGIGRTVIVEGNLGVFRENFQIKIKTADKIQIVK
jgi:DNA/RNA endonuclease YhcR with UshA esterase domain